MGRKKGKKKKGSGKQPKNKKKGGGGSSASSGASFQFLLRQYGAQNTNSQSFFDPFDSLSNSDLRNGFKHLTKKDETTKIKALKTLIQGIASESVDNVEPILPKFVKIFSRLCIDNSHKIREMSFLLFTVIAEKCQNQITPYLKDYMGPWLLGMQDLEREVRESATKGFEKIFPKRKRRIRALDYTMETVLQYFISNFNKTMEQLTPHKSAKPIEKKERYNRVLTCSILSLEYLIQTVPTSLSKYELFQNLCGNRNFWLFLKVKNFPRIRSATFSLLSTICRDLKELIDDTYLPFLTPLVFNVFREKDAMVQKSCFEALIAYLKTFPQCWGFVKDVWKEIFPQLWRFLRHPEVSQTHFFNILLPFLSLINYDILGGKNENSIQFFQSFFDNLKDGYRFVLEIRKDVDSLVRVGNAYFECLMFVILQSNLYINVDEKEEEEVEGEDDDDDGNEGIITTTTITTKNEEISRERIRKSFFEPIVRKYLIDNFIRSFFFRNQKVCDDDDDDDIPPTKKQQKEEVLIMMKSEDEVFVREKIVESLAMCLLRLTLHSGVYCSSSSSSSQQQQEKEKKGGQCLYDLMSHFWRSQFVKILVDDDDDDDDNKKQVVEEEEKEEEEMVEIVKKRNGVILMFINMMNEKSKAREELCVYLQNTFLKTLFWRILRFEILQSCQTNNEKRRRRRTRRDEISVLIDQFKVLNQIIPICHPFLLNPQQQQHEQEKVSFEEMLRVLVIEQKFLHVMSSSSKKVKSRYLTLRQEFYTFMCHLYHSQYRNLENNKDDDDGGGVQKKGKTGLFVERHFNPFFEVFLVHEKYGYNSPQTIMYFIQHLPHDLLLQSYYYSDDDDKTTTTKTKRKVSFLDWLLDEYVSLIVDNNPSLFLIDEETMISKTQRKKIKKLQLDDLCKILEFYVSSSSMIIKEEDDEEITMIEVLEKCIFWVKKDFMRLRDVKSVNQKYFTYSFHQDYDEIEEEESDDENIRNKNQQESESESEDEESDDEEVMGRRRENEKIVFREQIILKLKLLDFIVSKMMMRKSCDDDDNEKLDEFMMRLCSLFLLSHKYVANYYNSHNIKNKDDDDTSFLFFSKSEKNVILKTLEQLNEKFWNKIIISYVSETENHTLIENFEKLFIDSLVAEIKSGYIPPTKYFLKTLKMSSKRVLNLLSYLNNNNKKKKKDLICSEIFENRFFLDSEDSLWSLFRSKLSFKTSEKTKKYKMFILFFIWYIKQKYFSSLSEQQSQQQEEEEEEDRHVSSIERIFNNRMIENEMFYIRHEIASVSPTPPYVAVSTATNTSSVSSSFGNFEIDFLKFYDSYFVKLFLLKDYVSSNDNNNENRKEWICKIRKLLSIDEVFEKVEAEEHKQMKIRVYRVRSVLRFSLSEMLRVKDYRGIFELYLSLSRMFIFCMMNDDDDNETNRRRITESWVDDHVFSVQKQERQVVVLGWELFSIIHDSFFYFWEHDNLNGRRIRSIIMNYSDDDNDTTKKRNEFKVVLEDQLLIVSSLFITKYSSDSHNNENNNGEDSQQQQQQQQEEMKHLLKFVYVLLMGYSSVQGNQKIKKQQQQQQQEEEEDKNIINVQNVLRIVLDTTTQQHLSIFQTLKYIFSFIIQFQYSSSSSSSSSLGFLFSKTNNKNQEQQQDDDNKKTTTTTTNNNNILLTDILRFLKDDVWNGYLKEKVASASNQSHEEESERNDITKQDVQMVFYITKLYVFIMNVLIIEHNKEKQKHDDDDNNVLLSKIIEDCRAMILEELYVSMSRLVVTHEQEQQKRMMMMRNMMILGFNSSSSIEGEVHQPLSKLQNEEEEESVVLSTLYNYTNNTKYDDDDDEGSLSLNEWFVFKYCILQLCGRVLEKYYSSGVEQQQQQQQDYRNSNNGMDKKRGKLEEDLLCVLRRSKIIELQKLSLFLLKSSFNMNLLLLYLDNNNNNNEQVFKKQQKQEQQQQEEEGEEDDDDDEEEDLPIVIHPIAVTHHPKKMKKKNKNNNKKIVMSIEKEVKLIDSNSSENEGLSLFGYILSWDYFIFMFENLISSSPSPPSTTTNSKLLEKKKVKILNFLKNNPSQTYVPFLNLIFFQFLLTGRKNISEENRDSKDGDDDSDSDYDDDDLDDGMIKKEDRLYLDKILFSFLLNFSSLFRSFAQDNVSNEELKKKIEKYVNFHFSSKIIQKELNSLTKIYSVHKKKKKKKKKAENFFDYDSDDESNKSRVEVYKSSRTIKIIYTQDEINLSVTIQVPSNYPFQPLKLLKSSKFGIQKETWNKWILKLTFFLFNKNTSNIVHAVSLFLKNLEHYFKGAQECCICFSIINSLNYKIPDKKCKTCRKMFHGYCLFKWFSKSGKSTCPMCRQLF